MGMFDDDDGLLSGWDKDVQDEFSLDELMSDKEAEDFNDFLLDNNDDFGMPWDNKDEDDTQSDNEHDGYHNNYGIKNGDSKPF